MSSFHTGAKSPNQVVEELNQILESFIPEQGTRSWTAWQETRRMCVRADRRGQRLVALQWREEINRRSGEALLRLVDNYPEEVMYGVTQLIQKHSPRWERWREKAPVLDELEREFALARKYAEWVPVEDPEKFRPLRPLRLFRDWIERELTLWGLLLDRLPEPGDSEDLLPIVRAVRRIVRKHIRDTLERERPSP